MKKQMNFAKMSGFYLAVIVAGMMVVGCTLFRNLRENKNSVASPTPSATPVQVKSKAQLESELKAKTSEFTTLPAKTQLTTKPYIKGKAAFYLKNLKFEEKEAAWQYDHPEGGEPDLTSMAADDPDKVSSVVLISCSQIKKGNYSTGVGSPIPGYNRNCEMTLIDRTLPAIIYRKSFAGKLDEMEKIKSNATEIIAPIPYTQIYTFLNSLPRVALSVDGVLTVGDLIKQCQESPNETVSKYGDKEITVRGFANTEPEIPKGLDSTKTEPINSKDSDGSFSVAEKDDLTKDVNCRFKKADAAGFSKIKGDQFVTLKGVFNNSCQQPALSSCKVVKIE